MRTPAEARLDCWCGRYRKPCEYHDGWTDAYNEAAELDAENERLRLAILDIDAHATPLGEDDDGFVSVGYAISVGCLHRALGLVGHSAPKGITRVDLESDFIKMLYDLVPQERGLPIGVSALIWRAARELEAIADALPDGVSIDQLVATYNAVHGQYVTFTNLSRADLIIYLRSVKP